MATKPQRLCVGWILIGASLVFMVGNAFLVAEYTVKTVAGIPLVWFVVAGNLIVWGLGCVGMSLFKTDVDDDLDSKGKYQKIATMAAIADNLAEADGAPESAQLRHRIVTSLLQVGAEHVDPPRAAITSPPKDAHGRPLILGTDCDERVEPQIDGGEA